VSGRYDDIVLGLGGMGSAAAFHLARRGRRVLGLEQFDLLHERGSSHGATRIIRLAYHEHPSYVPLLRRAYELWHELEARSGERLLITTGSLEGGPTDGAIFRGALEAAELHDLEHAALDAREIERRFPGFHGLPASTSAVWQPDGGFLLAERTILAHVNLALGHGADLHFRERVTRWEAAPSGEGVTITTDAGTYLADRLIVCAGPWLAALVPELAHSAVPERQALIWIQPHTPELFGPDHFPVFLLDTEMGNYYGFPAHDLPGVKLGLYHHLGEPIEPDAVDRSASPRDEAVLRAFADRYLPEASGPTVMMKTCIFTNSPDEHFIIGALPDRPAVVVAGGFSGHGYKFCSVVGEILADLSMHGETAHQIDLFRPERVLA
jgi:sarcosine oxidase